MDQRDILLVIGTLATLGMLTVVTYAIDELHSRQDACKKYDALDRELEELIGGGSDTN